MPKTHKIDARLACRVVAELRKHREPVDDLLKAVGLRRSDVADEDTRIPYAALLKLIERAATALNEPALGLRLGASQDARNSGLLGFVALNSPTLVDALANVQRYFHVVGEGVDVEVERIGPNVILCFRETDVLLRGLRQNSDFMAALFVRVCRDITRKSISPVRAEFIHKRPNRKIDYSEYLGCGVRFDTDWDALIYRFEDMQLAVPGADGNLLRVLKASCQRILAATGPTKTHLVQKVRELIVDHLAKGTAQFDRIAAELNMSAKTLERRLADHETAFSTLLDDIRQDLAKSYLSDTDFRLEQIAYLVGYSEPAALVRAFRRWTGLTPLKYRGKFR